MILRENLALPDEVRAVRVERAIIAGFVATTLMTVVFGLAFGVGALLGSDQAGASLPALWLWGLTQNPITEMAQSALPVTVLFHFVAGIAWAVVYAAVAAPRLTGPAWRRGLTFSIVPALFSLVVFLPLAGGGLLGLGLGAGPLPILGNLILHAVYGVTLGQLYSQLGDRVQTDTGQPESLADVLALAGAETGMAMGIGVGLVLGAAVGWLVALAVTGSDTALVGALSGALAGSATGALIGSYAGLVPSAKPD